jgi:hypothetical protein
MPKVLGKYEPTEELTLRVHFDTDDNAIDSRTLASTLVFLKETLDEIQREYGSTKALALQVRPFETGSFGFPIDIFQYDFVALVASIDFHTLNEYVKTLIEIITLKITLKGAKAEKVEKTAENEVQVALPDGTHASATERSVNIYNHSSVVNYQINLAAGALKMDDSIKGMRLLDSKGEELLRLPKASFEMLEQADSPEPEPERSRVETAPLNIYQITFSERHQWQFYYHGIRISARIKDETFLERVAKGTERFANGDTLVCDLEVRQIFDHQANTYINHSYTITRVHQHHPRPEQGKIE